MFIFYGVLEWIVLKFNGNHCECCFRRGKGSWNMSKGHSLLVLIVKEPHGNDMLQCRSQFKHVRCVYCLRRYYIINRILCVMCIRCVCKSKHYYCSYLHILLHRANYSAFALMHLAEAFIQTSYAAFKLCIFSPSHAFQESNPWPWCW